MKPIEPLSIKNLVLDELTKNVKENYDAPLGFFYIQIYKKGNFDLLSKQFAQIQATITIEL